jgi:hypothetical protein
MNRKLFLRISREISQQIPLSSPSNPKNPTNPLPTNHFPQKKSWHTSFPISRIIKLVSKTKQTRPTAGPSLLTDHWLRSSTAATKSRPSPDLIQTKSR